MDRTTGASAVALTAALLLPSAAPAFGQCPRFDAEAEGHRLYAVALASRDGDLWDEQRRALQVPRTPSAEIFLVTDEDTCAKASQAYGAALDLEGPARHVHVVRIGPTRFLVWDPETRAGEFTLHVVFDENFAEIASYGG